MDLVGPLLLIPLLDKVSHVFEEKYFRPLEMN